MCKRTPLGVPRRAQCSLGKILHGDTALYWRCTGMLAHMYANVLGIKAWHARTQTLTRTQMHIHTHALSHTHTHAQSHTHTHMHTHMHSRTHTHTNHTRTLQVPDGMVSDFEPCPPGAQRRRIAPSFFKHHQQQQQQDLQQVQAALCSLCPMYSCVLCTHVHIRSS